MLGYTLKHILDLAPEALPHVKQASIEQDFPTGSKASTIASALAVDYQIRIARTPLDPDLIEKVAYATEAYGVKDLVSDLSTKVVSRHAALLEKSASANTEEKFLTKQAGWQGDLSGFKDLEEVVKQAETLYNEAQALGVNPNDEVKRYAGDAYLSKQAALGALNARFYLTKDVSFVKLAAAIGKEPKFEPGSRLVRSLCKTITGLDKKAGLLARGFDFYKEALTTKEAATSELSCKLAGKDVPLAHIMKLSSEHVSHYMGEDVANGLKGHPEEAKAIIDSLPADMKQVLCTLMQNA